MERVFSTTLGLAACVALALVLAPSMTTAQIVEDNSGLDADTPGNWQSSTGNANLRDNINDGDDNWLAQNEMHFAKAPFGQNNGTTNAEGFAGIYHTQEPNEVSMTYAFTAPTAIPWQGWLVKLTVNRSADKSDRLVFNASVNGGSFTQVDFSSTFGNGSASFDIDGGPTTSGWTTDGPTEQRVADLSALNIQPGDFVVYQFRFPNGSDGTGLNTGSGGGLGLGVQLNDIPEPATASLLMLGGLATLLRRRSIA